MSIILSPNMLLPLLYITEEDMVCTTNVLAKILPGVLIFPLTFKAPVTLKLLLTYNKFIEAVAAFVVPSDNTTLPIPGLLIVLNPVPLEPADPLVPVDPDVPVEPLLPDDPVEPELPEEPDEPEVPDVFVVEDLKKNCPLPVSTTT